MQYRRVFVPGGSYFFTVVTADRCRLFVVEQWVEVLRQAFREVMAKRPFRIDAIVVLPDHLHCIWALPPEDADFATRWRLVKTWFTKHCHDVLKDQQDVSQTHKRARSFWQHRYWEHLLRNEDDYRSHLEYIHYNPVKHGYVVRPADWPYSSFMSYVAKGIYLRDWGQNELQFEEEIGHE